MTNPTTSVFDRVIKALKADEDNGMCHLEGVDPLAKFVQDLSFDSLDCVVAAMGIEDEFDIEVTDEEMGKCEDVQSLVNLVEKKLALQPAPEPEPKPPFQQRQLSPPQDLAQQLWESKEIMSFNARVGLTMENLVELIGLVDKIRSTKPGE